MEVRFCVFGSLYCVNLELSIPEMISQGMKVRTDPISASLLSAERHRLVKRVLCLVHSKAAMPFCIAPPLNLKSSV